MPYDRCVLGFRTVWPDLDDAVLPVESGLDVDVSGTDFVDTLCEPFTVSREGSGDVGGWGVEQDGKLSSERLDKAHVGGPDTLGVDPDACDFG